MKKTTTTTRTTEITTERDEVHVIGRIGKRKAMWCAKCAAEVERKEVAFKALFQVLDHRESLMALYNVDPMFDGLRSDPSL
jgi:hypothetical protein